MSHWIPRASLLLAVALTLALAALAFRVRENPVPLVIRPGNEERIARFVNGPAGPAAPPVDAIRIEQSIIEVVLAGGAGTLEVHPGEYGGRSIARSSQVAVVWRGAGHPSPATIAYAGVIAGRADGGVWERVPMEVQGVRVESAASRLGLPRRACFALVLATLLAAELAAAALLKRGGRGRGAPGTEAMEPVRGAFREASRSALVVGASAGAAACAAAMAAGFRFKLDDYGFLVRAHEAPWDGDVALRWLTTTVHFAIGGRLGDSPIWFAAANLLALAATCIAWAHLVRRAGVSGRAAALSGALLAVGPGASFLLRQGCGIEHLAGSALLLLILLLVDEAAREEADRDRRGALVLLAFAFSGILLFAKYPLVPVVPVACWLWARFVVPRPAGALRRHATWLLFAIGVGALVALVAPLGESTLGFNVSGLAIEALRRSLLALAGATLILVVARFAPRPPQAIGPAGAGGPARSLAADLWRDLTLPVGGLPLLASAAALSSLFAFPFLWNARYIGGPHYAWLAFAPLSVPFAVAMVRLERRGAAGVAGALLAAAVLVSLPWKDGLRPTVEDRLAAWVSDLRALAADRPRPGGVLVASAPGCAADDPYEQERQIVAFRHLTAFGRAVQWATGWFGAPVFFRVGDGLVGEEGIDPQRVRDLVTLRYCDGQPPRIEAGAGLPGR